MRPGSGSSALSAREPNTAHPVGTARLKDLMGKQGMGQNNLLRGLLLVVLGAAFGGCAVNPVTGAKEVGFVSESQELALGQQNY